MRCIVKYHEKKFPPMLEMYIFGAPHRRQCVNVMQSYRDCLIKAAKEAKIAYPIRGPVELSVLFIDPSSPDLDNLIMALYRALDAKALKKIGLLADDGNIQKVIMSKYFPNGGDNTVS